MRRIVACGILLCLSGCGATAVTLTYAPTHPVSKAAHASGIAAVTVTDHTGEDGHYVGTIRGGYGNPLKTIRTEAPVADEVRAAIISALQARGLLAQTGDTLSVDLTRFDVNQYSRREAHADFSIALSDPSGRVVYQDHVQAQQINGSIVTFDKGVFASPADLQALMAQTMDEAIDTMLDKPGFAAALSAR